MTDESVSKAKSLPTIVKVPALQEYTINHSLKLTDVQKKLWMHVETKSDCIMAGAPEEASFLSFLCGTINAKKVVEIGTYYGLTTLELALKLPEDGKVVTVDISEAFISEARPFWSLANVEQKIDVRIGKAVLEMDKMIEAGDAGTVDLVFIDADKGSYDAYYEKALVLLRKGGIVAIDNVHWFGHILDEEKLKTSGDTIAIDQLNKKIYDDARVSMVMLGMADGLTLCRKL